MPGIVEFPKLVQDALAQYGDLFANECQRRHFAEYLTGLIVAERKTVLGIHDEFAQTTDQSCLNRFLTEAAWDVEALNQRRLERLQKDPSTRYSDQGVIPIDNTLIDRDGMLIPDAGWYWDHAEERYKIAQDYLFVNYVCTCGKHYPLEFRLFRKEEVCEALKEPFRNHTELVLRVDRLGVRAADPRRLHHGQLLHQRRDPQPHPRQDGSARAAAGLRRRPEDQPQAGVEGPDPSRPANWRPSIPAADRKELRIGDRRQWYFTVTVRIPDVKHKVRIVILWQYRQDDRAAARSW